jgi:hypothetical protein
VAVYCFSLWSAAIHRRFYSCFWFFVIERGNSSLLLLPSEKTKAAMNRRTP